MAEPLGFLEALQERYGHVAFGLLLGTMGKYGLTLTEGRPITAREIVADVLMQGVLGLVAIAVTKVLGLTGDGATIVGALAALNSARLVQWAKDTFFDRAKQLDLVGTAKASPATIVEVPAGTDEPASIAIQPGTADDPTARAGAALKGAYDSTTRRRPPADQIELLKKLPE